MESKKWGFKGYCCLFPSTLGHYGNLTQVPLTPVGISFLHSPLLLKQVPGKKFWHHRWDGAAWTGFGIAITTAATYSRG
jgi:hypothetical protein